MVAFSKYYTILKFPGKYLALQILQSTNMSSLYSMHACARKYCNVNF